MLKGKVKSDANLPVYLKQIKWADVVVVVAALAVA